MFLTFCWVIRNSLTLANSSFNVNARRAVCFLILRALRLFRQNSSFSSWEPVPLLSWQPPKLEFLVLPCFILCAKFVLIHCTFLFKPSCSALISESCCLLVRPLFRSLSCSSFSSTFSGVSSFFWKSFSECRSWYILFAGFLTNWLAPSSFFLQFLHQWPQQTVFHSFDFLIGSASLPIPKYWLTVAFSLLLASLPPFRNLHKKSTVLVQSSFSLSDYDTSILWHAVQRL